jgi:phosphatidylglycerophosphate synthase
MRKIPSNLENPIDDILLKIIDKIQPGVYKLGFTPNILTTFSLLFWVGGLYFFVNSGVYYTYYTVILMAFSYFFDCFDGHFARTYDMVTKFGDYYDHISDISKILLLIYFILVKYTAQSLIVLPIIVISMILSFMHLSCQELYYGLPTDTLNFLNIFCVANKDNVKSVMNITKHFGCGTMYFIIILCVIYLKMNKTNEL